MRLGRSSLNMRILITGGFGFIGGRLAVYLAKSGHQIILGTRHSVSPPDWLLQAEVAQILWNDKAALERNCAGIDVIIHAAGMNAQDCIADPAAASAFNGEATERLVIAASRSGVNLFIYLSTAHVYAKPLIGNITEATDPCNPHHYATSSLSGEDAVLNSNHCQTIQRVVLRLSNAFGAPMHKEVNCWTLLVNDLCRQAVTKQRLTIHTAGLQRRDFLTLEDLSRATSHVISLPKDLIDGEVFNVGGSWAPRVIDVVQLVQLRCTEVLGFTPKISHAVKVDDEVTHNLDFRIDKLLASGFEPSGSAMLEIDATLLFCRKNFGNN